MNVQRFVTDNHFCFWYMEDHLPRRVNNANGFGMCHYDKVKNQITFRSYDENGKLSDVNGNPAEVELLINTSTLIFRHFMNGEEHREDGPSTYLVKLDARLVPDIQGSMVAAESVTYMTYLYDHLIQMRNKITYEEFRLFGKVVHPKKYGMLMFIMRTLFPMFFKEKK